MSKYSRCKGKDEAVQKCISAFDPVRLFIPECTMGRLRHSVLQAADAQGASAAVAQTLSHAQGIAFRLERCLQGKYKGTVLIKPPGV